MVNEVHRFSDFPNFIFFYLKLMMDEGKMGGEAGGFPVPGPQSGIASNRKSAWINYVLKIERSKHK